MIARRSDTFGTVTPRLKSAILAHADQMELDRHMPLALHLEMKDAGLFSLCVPAHYGGLALPLPDALRVVEEVAAIDGSAGWTVALGFAAGYFPGFVSPEVEEEVLGRGPILMAGGGRPMSAEVTDGGYFVSGQLSYASGIVHADWVSGLAMLMDGEAPRMGPNGPEMVGYLIPRGQYEVVDTWNATGMRGTGTHDARFERVFVPGERIIPLISATAFTPIRGDTLSRFPFPSLAGIVQAAPNCLGVARHALEEFATIATGKVNPMTGLALRDRGLIQAGYARAEASLRAARLLFYSAVQDAWDRVDRGETLELEHRTSVRLACSNAAEASLDVVESLFRMAGTTATTYGTTLERCWRDAHTAASHVQVQDPNWEAAGRSLLGLEPGTVMF